MNALIIDDSPFIRRLIQGVLMGSCKFSVVIQKEDGHSALEELENNPEKYDIIFLDWHMPLMDGIDVLLAIRRSHISTPVIMCTSLGDKESIINAVSAGANEYLVKPFEVACLEEKVKKVLEVEKNRKEIRHLRALVVDDSSTMRKIVAHILVNDGIFTDVVHAEDGDVALELYPNQKFDLIFLDWEMPRMKGIDVLKAIRTFDSSIPIVMATSNTKLDHMVEAFDAGVSNFIAKPFTAPGLLKKVNQVLIQ